MGRKEQNQTKILEILNEGAMNYELLKKKFGTGIDMRYPLQVLLKENRIRISEYNPIGKYFAFKKITFEKVNPDCFSQIYIKNLIDDIDKKENFNELREIFKKKVLKVNKAFKSDINQLKESIDKMPIKKSLDLLMSEENHKKTNYGKSESKGLIKKLKDHCNEYPMAKVWYFKEFSAKNLRLKRVFLFKSGPPYFSIQTYIDDQGSMSKEQFILLFYRSGLSYIPIHHNAIDEVFNKLILYVLKLEKDKKESAEWEIAELLSEDGKVREFAYYLNDFIEKIEFNDIGESKFNLEMQL